MKLWEAPSGSPLGYDGQHQDSILSIDIASHGLAFASGSADGRRGYGIPLLPDLAANQSSTPVPYPLSSSMRRQPISQLDQATAKCLFGTHYRRELFLFGYPGQTRYSWQS